MLMQNIALNHQRLAQVKRAFTTRNVPLDAMSMLLTGYFKPQAGDLVLARVDAIGQHKTVHLSQGRKSALFEGDEILVCYGDRYAPDQFEAEVPQDLSPCHLVAAGGLAGWVRSQNTSLDIPTEITPLGLVADHQGQRLNLHNWSLPVVDAVEHQPTTLVVIGSAMNSGKTTVAAHLIRGLVAAGQQVSAGKVTGTGAGGDVWLMEDAGASQVLDFCDVGVASTYKINPLQLKQVFQSLINHLAANRPDFIVLEVADGLYQQETAHLLQANYFRQSIDGILFAARGAVDALGGITWLKERALNPLAVSGRVTTSPLARQEAAIATGLRVLTLEELSSEHLLPQLVEGIQSLQTPGPMKALDILPPAIAS